MLEVIPTTKFKKDLTKYKHHQNIVKELNEVLKTLAKGQPLPRKCVDHPLGGNWKGSRDCHVTPDTLLIYRIDEIPGKLYLERFGSHSELFK